MNKCLLDFPHAPVWCDYHFEEERRSQELQTQRDIHFELRRSNDLRELELEQGRPARRAPYRPPVTQSPTPAESDKPQIRGRSL